MNADDRDAVAARALRTQRLIGLASGVLVIFFAVGFGAWFSGALSWVGFYAGARGRTLVTLAQVTASAGFALGIVMTLGWYWRRCRRGEADISPRAALLACMVLPLGNIFWAVFVDAIAYHYGRDIVRPAFDYAIMYLILGGLPPLALGVPWLVSHLRSRSRSRGAAASGMTQAIGT